MKKKFICNVYFCVRLDTIHVDKEKNAADAEFYRIKMQADSNKLLLTKEYLELKRIEALGNNTKFYYGPDIPKIFMQQYVP